MAFWKRNQAEYEQMARLIEEKPGIRPGQLAGIMKVRRSTILRRLPALEEAGILLSEDRQGRLSLFGRRK
jgi:Mn-dependent DtxR family transcriptional regulator